jgi:hypothetical protein
MRLFHAGNAVRQPMIAQIVFSQLMLGCEVIGMVFCLL